MTQLSASGGQSIGVSASTSVPSNEHPGLISFRMDWLDLLAVQGTLKGLIILYISALSVVTSPFSFLILLMILLPFFLGESG